MPTIVAQREFLHQNPLQASNLFSPGEIGHQGWLLEEKPGIYATVSFIIF
jgi:hypothetical protein